MLNGTAVCDGLCTTTPHTAVHSTFYALFSGLLDDDAALTSALAEHVRARAFADTLKGVPCGAYPVQFLLAALYADGADHGNAAHAVLTASTLHSYRHMIEAYGATATMECWVPEELPNLSFSHVWSSSPAFLVPQFFFGLTPTSPGFATLDIRPQPGRVREGNATLPTVRGPVAISFTQTVPGAPGGCMAIRVGLPGGVRARVFVPRWGRSVVVTLDGAVVSSTELGDFAFVQGVGAGVHTVSSC
jgi:alpha-L-rhamnosidase